MAAKLAAHQSWELVWRQTSRAQQDEKGINELNENYICVRARGEGPCSFRGPPSTQGTPLPTTNQYRYFAANIPHTHRELLRGCGDPRPSRWRLINQQQQQRRAELFSLCFTLWFGSSFRFGRELCVCHKQDQDVTQFHPALELRAHHHTIWDAALIPSIVVARTRVAYKLITRAHFFSSALCTVKWDLIWLIVKLCVWTKRWKLDAPINVRRYTLLSWCEWWR